MEKVIDGLIDFLLKSGDETLFEYRKRNPKYAFMREDCLTGEISIVHRTRNMAKLAPMKLRMNAQEPSGSTIRFYYRRDRTEYHWLYPDEYKGYRKR